MKLISNVNRIVLEAPVRIINANEAFGSLDMSDDADITYIGFTLCHEGANKKGDRFTLDELKRAWKSIAHKPINWEHAEPNVGVVLDSALKVPEGRRNEDKLVATHSPAQIDCVGGIWKARYPEYNALITKGAQDGSLKVSMEAYFQGADYVIGEYDETIPEDEAPEGMQHYLGTYAEKFSNKFVSRALKDVIFGGVGITATPADSEARIWACAFDKSAEEYHEYLHDVYEGRKMSVMTKDMVVTEHEKVTRSLLGLA
jgi:hypothetical protein